MKYVGLTAVGTGGAAAITPVFHDIDEAIVSNSNGWKRPWYVKERELGNPTIEIDWSQTTRYDARETAHVTHAMAQYYGADQIKNVLATSGVGIMQGKCRKDAVTQGQKGFNLRDNALRLGAAVWATGSWTGPTVTGPDFYGLPRWNDSPENNLRMLRAAMNFYGAAAIAVSEFSENEKKLLCSWDRGGATFNATYIDQWPPPITVSRKIEIENVDQGYVTPEKFVVPNNPKMFVVGFTIPMSRDAWRCNPSAVLDAANISRYRLRGDVENSAQAFIKALGFQCLGLGPYPLLAAQASAVLGGTAELARNHCVAISPERGPIDGYYEFMTDLPLEPTHPIDAGLNRFCHSCHKCADFCPPQVITYDKEPSWDPPQKAFEHEQGIPPRTSAPNKCAGRGKKVFWSDSPACNYYNAYSGLPAQCGMCMSTCTFNVNTGAMVHQVVKGIVGTTDIFNGLFYQGAKTFGYGASTNKVDSWWAQDYPAYGYDTVAGSHNGGY